MKGDHSDPIMPDSDIPPAVVVMGVYGTGKSTIGRELASRLGSVFVDAAEHHPAANLAKIRQGFTLTDNDREIWLSPLRRLIEAHQTEGRGVVVACSALRESDREQLQPAGHDLHFVFLQADRDRLLQRLSDREDPAQAARRLDADLATLEVPAPAEALWCDATHSPTTIVDDALSFLRD